MNFLKYKMLTSTSNLMTACEWMLLTLFSAVIAGHISFTNTAVQTVHRGMSVNISCNYKPTNNSIVTTVELETNKTLCLARNVHQSLILQSCEGHIRFIWIPNNISFEISNLQIKDSGTYKCVQTRILPPPFEPLGEAKTVVQVIARPIVSVSHRKVSDGFQILCSSEGFYPSPLKQTWLRNGELQDISLTVNITKTNTDGSFSLYSYLNSSDCENYSCWVNHSSLSQPTILHINSNNCYENTSRNVSIALVTSALLIAIILIVCEFYRRAYRMPPGVTSTHGSGSHTYLENDIYSSVGYNNPIPCRAPITR